MNKVTECYILRKSKVRVRVHACACMVCCRGQKCSEATYNEPTVLLTLDDLYVQLEQIYQSVEQGVG